MRRTGLALVALLVAASTASAQVREAVRARAQQEKNPFLDTLKELVSIESGSTDIEGLNRIADVIAGRLQALGAEIEVVAPRADMVRFETTPRQTGKMIVGRFRGTGTKKILLLAHMDTVYLRGMLARQPFRIDGERAYGLGIADDKQGVALILHTIALLRALNVHQYGLLTILINGDEEVSSVGSRALITRLGAEHDVVLSCEGGGLDDRVTLATAGIGAVQMSVKGRASHAGSAPERGRNALYELAHQILQMRDLSNPATGVKMNWTLAKAGSAQNAIPAEASATADVRVLRVADYDRIEQQVRERVRTTLIPETVVEVTFERTRPPMEPTSAARGLAAHAQRIYAEMGGTLKVGDVAGGGGTDAAFAALSTKAPVIEAMGVRTFGSHSNDAEYIEIASIERRLYLLTRLIMDVASGAARLD